MLSAIGLPALLIVAGLIWRYASQRQSLPCPVWLRWLVEMDNPFTRTNRAAVILQHLRLQPGMTVLDIGCGPGRLTLPCARAVGTTGRVLALDIQAGMLQRTRDKARHAGLTNIDFIEADITAAALPPNQADRALLVTVLGEVPDRPAALRAVHAALKPGGLLSVTEIIFDPHFQRRSSVLREATAAGFRQAGFFGNAIAYTLHLEKAESIPVS